MTGVWAAALWAAAGGFAQIDFQRAATTQPQDRAFVPDSFETSAAIDQAQELAGRAQWDRAAELLARTAQRDADKVVAVEPGRYVGVPRRVHALLAGGAPELLAAYRRRWEPIAAEALAAAKASARARRLEAVARRYFPTRAGAEAADLAARHWVEAGRFGAAAGLYRDLLGHHPDRDAWAPRVRPMLALCLSWSDQAREASTVLDALRASAGPARVAWAGESMPLETFIAEVVQRPPEAPGGPRAFAWPMLMGSPARDQVPATAGAAGAILWQHALGEQAPADARPLGGLQRSGRDSGRSVNLHCALDREMVYACDGTQVVAIRQASGAVAWRHEAQRLDRPVVARYGVGTPGVLNTVTVHDRCVYALLRRPGRGRSGDGTNQTTAWRVVCLSGDDGRRLWELSPARMPEGLGDLEPDTAPVRYDGALYVVGRRLKTVGFEECFLLCLNTEDGAVRWSRYLGSGSVGGYGVRQTTASPPAAADGCIYVATNLGSVAAVQTADAQIRWLRTYSRPTGRRRAWGLWSNRWTMPMVPWAINPPIVVGGHLVCLPTDAAALLVLDRGDGAVVHQWPRNGLHEMTTLLGVLDDKLYGVGARISCLDLTSGQETWSRSLADGQLRGRGFLTRSAAYVPTTAGLQAYPLDGSAPQRWQWDPRKEGGNVLVAPGMVIAAGGGHVTAYAEMEVAFRRLRERIAADPGAPDPVLDLAETAFRAGRIEMAIEQIDEAIRLAGAGGVMSPEVRRRIFGDCLSFAEALRMDEPPRLDQAAALLTRAAGCAPDVAGHVRYRLALAEVRAEQRRFADAVEQYHQIVRDGSLRRHPIARPGDDESDRPTPAGQLARERIARILREQGREPYEPLERRARELLTSAAQAGRVEVLERIWESYPNSRAAAEALVKAGDLLAAAGNPLDAARRYRQAWVLYPDTIDAPAVMKQLADSYLAAGKAGPAAQWLGRAVREFPGYRFEHSGRRIGFADYRQAVIDPEMLADVRLPAIAPPLRRGYVRTFEQSVSVLEPIDPEQPGQRTDLLVVHHGNGVELLDPQTGQPRWPQPVAFRVRPDLLGDDGENLILATRHRITALRIADGTTVWHRGEYPADLGEAGVDPEWISSFSAHALQGRRWVSVRNHGEAMSCETRSGQIRWQRKLDLMPAGKILTSQEFVIYRATRGRQTVFCVLDIDTGRAIRTLAPTDLGGAFWYRLSPEGMLVSATNQSLHAMDPYTGRTLWSLRVDGAVYVKTLQVGLDGVFGSQDGRRIVKRSWRDGQPVWTASVLADPANAAAVQTRLDAGRLYVFGPQAIWALAGATGQILWSGAADGDVRFESYHLARDYIVAIDARRAARGEAGSRRYTAYFYDRRDDSGLIPADGGVLTLGQFETPRTISVRDRALLVAEPKRLVGFVPTPP